MTPMLIALVEEPAGVYWFALRCIHGETTTPLVGDPDDDLARETAIGTLGRLHAATYPHCDCRGFIFPDDPRLH